MKNFFNLKVAEFPAKKFSADNGVKNVTEKISCRKFTRASKNLFKRFNIDLKASNFNDKPPCNFSMIIYSRKKLNAATAIFERNSGISNFFNRNKNIR